MYSFVIQVTVVHIDNNNQKLELMGTSEIQQLLEFTIPLFNPKGTARKHWHPIVYVSQGAADVINTFTKSPILIFPGVQKYQNGRHCILWGWRWSPQGKGTLVPVLCQGSWC